MTTAFGTLLFAAMLTLLPWRGARAYRKMKAGAVPRLRAYRMLLVAEAIYATLALVYAGLTGRAGEVVPLRPIAAPLLARWSFLLPGLLVGGAIGLILPVVVPKLRRRILEKGGDFLALVPRTAAERWLFVPVAISAGIGEELLFRGYAWDFLSRQVGLPALAAFVVAAASFGVAHWYQGVRGIFGTTLLAALLLALYLISGSLLLPIALHALIDLRVIALSVGLTRSSPDGLASRS